MGRLGAAASSVFIEVLVTTVSQTSQSTSGMKKEGGSKTKREIQFKKKNEEGNSYVLGQPSGNKINGVLH
jgi:hypothetical protein